MDFLNESVKKILEKLESENDVTFEDGYFIFSEENPVLREDFIQSMKEKGFYTDTSHNKEIIKVKAIALLAFLTDGSDISVLKELVQKSDFNNEKLKKYFISQKTWKDVTKDLLDIFKESEGDAKKILFNAASYSLDILNAKYNAEENK